MISSLVIREITSDGTKAFRGEISLDATGNIELTLDRKDDGSIFVAGAEIKRNDFWKEIESLELMLKSLHTQMIETQTMFQACHSALFALKKYM